MNPNDPTNTPQPTQNPANPSPYPPNQAPNNPQGLQSVPQQSSPTPAYSAAPMQASPLQQNPNPYTPPQKNNNGILKIVIISIVAVFILVLVSVVGFIAFVNAQFSEENKLSSQYIQALRDEDYEEVGKLYDPELAKFIEKYQDVSEQIKAIDLSIPTATEEDLYQAYLKESEQDFSVPDGEPVRTSYIYHDSADPKYVVSIYNVGDKAISVLAIYDTSGNPKIFASKEDEYDMEESELESSYKKYKEEISDAIEELEKLEEQIDQFTQGAAPQTSLRAPNSFLNQ